MSPPPPPHRRAIFRSPRCDVMLGPHKTAWDMHTDVAASHGTLQHGILRPIAQGREENCFAGGGMARRPICPTPPSPSLVAVPGGGFGLGLPYLPCPGGGGATPTYMAQNDPHVALIILTTHMWGEIFS